MSFVFAKLLLIRPISNQPVLLMLSTAWVFLHTSSLTHNLGHTCAMTNSQVYVLLYSIEGWLLGVAESIKLIFTLLAFLVGFDAYIGRTNPNAARVDKFMQT